MHKRFLFLFSLLSLSLILQGCVPFKLDSPSPPKYSEKIVHRQAKKDTDIFDFLLEPIWKIVKESQRL